MIFRAQKVVVDDELYFIMAKDVDWTWIKDRDVEIKVKKCVISTQKNSQNLKILALKFWNPRRFFHFYGFLSFTYSIF
jgi:hypothetical protein